MFFKRSGGFIGDYVLIFVVFLFVTISSLFGPFSGGPSVGDLGLKQGDMVTVIPIFHVFWPCNIYL